MRNIADEIDERLWQVFGDVDHDAWKAVWDEVFLPVEERVEDIVRDCVIRMVRGDARKRKRRSKRS